MGEEKPEKSHLKHPTILFLVELVKGRWMAVSISFYILLFSGATYIFGIYSGSIKTSLHYNQQTIDMLSFFKDLGGNVGIVAGLISQISPPWLVLFLGSILNFFGYFMIWLCITHRVPRPPLGAMYLYMYTGSNSQTFVHTAVLVSCVKNFPKSRGMVLGLTKGCIGLSGAVFTQFYHALYGGSIGDDTRSLVLLISWLPSIIVLAFMWFIRLTDPSTSCGGGEEEERGDGVTPIIKEEKQFFSYLYLALLLAGFLMLAIILENVLSLPTLAFKLIGCVTLLLVGSNALVAVRAENKIARHGGRRAPSDRGKQATYTLAKSNTKESKTAQPGHQTTVEEGKITVMDGGETSRFENKTTCSDPLTSTKEGGPKVVLEASSNMNSRSSAGSKHYCTSVSSQVHNYFNKDWPNRGDDFTIAQALFSLDFWILLISVTCGVGTSLAAIDNMGQIGASLGYPTLSISTCVSLISIWNFLGRVTSGFGSDYLLQRYRFSRSLVLSIILGSSCIGHLMIAFPGPGTLYVASALIGFCFGALWPPLYAVISEIFGLKYFATLYNVVGVASPLGSYLFNVKVAGYLYDKEASRQSGMKATKDLVCDGVHCFRLTFLVMTVVCAMGCSVSAFLVVRTRKFYTQDMYDKYHPKNVELGQCHSP